MCTPLGVPAWDGGGLSYFPGGLRRVTEPGHVRDELGVGGWSWQEQSSLGAGVTPSLG